MARIVHYGKYYSPDTGGIESVTVSLARAAVAARHSVSVVCFGKSGYPQEEVIEGVRIFRAPISKIISSQPLGFFYLRYCVRVGNKADIIHLHAPNMLAFFAFLFLKKDVCLLVHWHSDVIGKGMLGLLFRPLEFALLKRANCIVATSEEYANSSQALSKIRNKVVTIPIGLSDISCTDIGFKIPREINDKISSKKIVLSIGRLVKYKGFDILIRAAKYMASDSLIVIVGGGPLRNDLQMQAESLGVSDRIFFAGRLPSEALYALLKNATVFCLPSTSRAEAFGVVLLEAMAMRLPIVATDISGSGVPWVNKNGVSGLNVPVADPIALANACNKILGSQDYREKLAIGARSRYLTEFTENSSTKKFLALYDHLILSRKI